MIKLKNNIEDLLDSLSKSKFRGSFHLNKKMKDYVKEKGFDKIKLDARDLITKRIAPETKLMWKTNTNETGTSSFYCSTCYRLLL